MEHEAIKSDLIDWGTKPADEEINEYHKAVKDAVAAQDDWWINLTDDQKSETERGLKDVDEGRVTPHNIVKGKYGL
ncbi:MAG: hypothetical protein ACM3O8_11715 [Methylococcaceae bacterium]|nr:hypothetical protein [Prolixibacteraceae bacterium]